MSGLLYYREFNIARLTCETYLKYFSLTIEGHSQQFSSSECVRRASKDLFALYKKLKETEKMFADIIGYFKIISHIQHSEQSFSRFWIQYSALVPSFRDSVATISRGENVGMGHDSHQNR